MVDEVGLARKIDPACILRLTSGVPSKRFPERNGLIEPKADNREGFDELPLTTTDNPLTSEQRMAQGLLSLASSVAGGGQGGTFMQARIDGPMFDIPAIELDRIPLQPNYLPESTPVS